VKAAENRNFQDPSKTTEELPPKKKNRKKRNPQESWQEWVLGVKKRDS